MRVNDSRRGGVLGGLLILGAVFICVAATIAITVARNVSVRTERSERGDNVSIETPAGRFSIHAHDETGRAKVDVPRYPGAWQKPHSGGGAVFEWSSNEGRDDKAFSVAGEEWITSDPVQRVVEFYQAALPNWVIANDKDNGFRMELAEGGYKRILVIDRKLDGTHIGVATIGAPAAN